MKGLRGDLVHPLSRAGKDALPISPSKILMQRIHHKFKAAYATEERKTGERDERGLAAAKLARPCVLVSTVSGSSLQRTIQCHRSLSTGDMGTMER